MQKAEQTRIFTEAMMSDPEQAQTLLRQVTRPVSSRRTVDRIQRRQQDLDAR